jgi:hypothetical protein
MQCLPLLPNSTPSGSNLTHFFYLFLRELQATQLFFLLEFSKLKCFGYTWALAKKIKIKRRSLASGRPNFEFVHITKTRLLLFPVKVAIKLAAGWGWLYKSFTPFDVFVLFEKTRKALHEAVSCFADFDASTSCKNLSNRISEVREELFLHS